MSIASCPTCSPTPGTVYTEDSVGREVRLSCPCCNSTGTVADPSRHTDCACVEFALIDLECWAAEEAREYRIRGAA